MNRITRELKTRLSAKFYVTYSLCRERERESENNPFQPTPFRIHSSEIEFEMTRRKPVDNLHELFFFISQHIPAFN